MSYALDSAEKLAAIFNAGGKDRDVASLFEQYRAGTRKIRLKLLTKILKNPFMYNPQLRTFVMKSGITAI
jgi:hypothetical protein